MIRILKEKTTWTKIISVMSVIVFAALIVTVAVILLSDRQRVMDNNARLVELYGELYEQSEKQGVDPTTPDPGIVKKESNEVVAGPRGATGATGSSGSVGPRGPAGPQGVMGERGQAGPAGPTGAAGEVGKAGIDGSNGLPGGRGNDGATGAAGPAGADGAPGTPGAAGATGPQGEPGINGSDGRGIQSLTCNEDGSWSVAYTDGTSMVTPGPCRVFVDIPSIPAG